MQYLHLEALNVTDEQLVELARRGDESAFGELVLRHRQKCVYLASFILRNEGDAEDQVQIAFLKAYKHLDQYHGKAEFSTWLTRIVINQCRIQMRAQRRAEFLRFDEGYLKHNALFPVRRDTERELALQQLRQIVKREIGLMPQLLRNVVILYYIRGLPLGEVAYELGITVPGAKSRLGRARTELRSRMARHYRELTDPSPTFALGRPVDGMYTEALLQR